MTRLQRRGSIALAAVMVALLSSTAVQAQGLAEGMVEKWPAKPPGGLWNDLATGVQYDRANQAKAIWHLQCLEAKIKDDAERGRTAAVARDARLIDNHRWRIAVDTWLIRQNTLQDPCYYPVRNVCVPDCWYGCVPQTPCPPGVPCRR